jgi:mono/diheme cytochrome c family protein
MRGMFRAALRATTAALIGLVVLPLAAHAAPDEFTRVERGRALVAAGDCVACHTVAGAEPFSGGKKLATPFGDIAAPNLTPDNETGLGLWSTDDFARAMQQGISRNGMHLYPAFPYTYYTHVSREDIDDIYAFLRTLPAVHNPVDRNTLPFPYNMRILMNGWNTLFFRPGPLPPEGNHSAEYERGRYLVDGLGHCGECHTPMNWAGANKDSDYLQGNVIAGWVAPDITSDNYTGLGTWSVDEIVEYLRTGRNVHSAASGPMAEVVSDSTSWMTDPELHAIATYLKERPGPNRAAPTPIAANDAQMQRGEAVYIDSCKACHTSTGDGQALLFPRLAGDRIVMQHDPSSLLNIVLNGVQAAATARAPTAPAMPAFSWRLTDQQVADVVTYIRNSWGNAAPAVTADQAQHVRAAGIQATD